MYSIRQKTGRKGIFVPKCTTVTGGVTSFVNFSTVRTIVIAMQVPEVPGVFRLFPPPHAVFHDMTV